MKLTRKETITLSMSVEEARLHMICMQALAMTPESDAVDVPEHTFAREVIEQYTALVNNEKTG